MKIFVGALVILALQRHLGREHRHEMTRLEGDLNRELSKAKKEFTRESRGEVKFEKILEKRHKLEKKADKAYAKFKEKAAEKIGLIRECRLHASERAWNPTSFIKAWPLYYNTFRFNPHHSSVLTVYQ